MMKRFSAEQFRQIYQAMPRTVAVSGCLIAAAAVLFVALALANPSPKQHTVRQNLPLRAAMLNLEEDRYWVEEAVQAGDTLSDVLSRIGISPAVFTVRVGRETLNSKTQTLRLGQSVSIQFDHTNRPLVIQYVNDDDNGEYDLVVLEQQNGKWQASSADLPLQKMPTLRSVRVRTSAQGSLAQAGVGVELRESLREMFRGRVDLDALEAGDVVRLLYDTLYFRGLEMGSDDILAAEVEHGGTVYRAYFYHRPNNSGSYYDEGGNVLQAAGGFSVQPVAYTRISSPYGIRVHPILRTVKMHTGIDFAAPSGTPVYAPADGAVVFRGWKGGYGRTVMLQHGNGVVTLYGHMSAFAPIAGTVTAGQIIGYVGTSGRSTGPHLHYEARLNGQPVNPTTIALPGVELSESDKPVFQRQQQQAEQLFALVRGVSETVAQAD